MLDAAGAAASSISSVGDAILGGMKADLAAAKAAGDAQQLKVDLQALYDYYFKVKSVYETFKQSLVDLPEEPYSSQQLEVSPISGVTDAVQTTVSTALSMTGNSMKRGVMVVESKLAEHLVKIADTYTAYVHVDDQKASELQSAGTSVAGDVSYGGGSRAADYTKEYQAVSALGAALGPLG
jgi:hypothetical protein